MANITGFPVIDNAHYIGSFTFSADASATLDASGCIKSGMVVGFSDTGVSRTLAPSKHNYSGAPIGVALDDASAGEMFTVIGPGCIAIVANANAVAIDAGEWLEVSDNCVGGTVCARQDWSGNHFLIGQAWDDIPGSGTGAMIINPCFYTEYRDLGG